jgi:hypothetical protein
MTTTVITAILEISDETGAIADQVHEGSPIDLRLTVTADLERPRGVFLTDDRLTANASDYLKIFLGAAAARTLLAELGRAVAELPIDPPPA